MHERILTSEQARQFQELGFMVTAFSLLEMALHLLVETAIDAQHGSAGLAGIVTGRLQFAGVADLVERLAKADAFGARSVAVQEAVGTARGLAERRNVYIHSVWGFAEETRMARIRDLLKSPDWSDVFAELDEEVLHALGDDCNSLATTIFTNLLESPIEQQPPDSPG